MPPNEQAGFSLHLTQFWVRLSLRNLFAVSVNLSYSTAMLITPRLRVSYAAHPTRCLISKTRPRGRIAHEHFGLRLSKGMRWGETHLCGTRVTHRAGCAERPRMKGHVRGLRVLARGVRACSGLPPR